MGASCSIQGGSMNFIPSSSTEFTNLIRNTLGDPSDLRFESLMAGKAIIAYIAQMVN
jgi:hypothetical protein